MGYFLLMASDNVIVLAEFVAKQSRQQEEDMQTAKKSSGDGGNNMETRLVRLETIIEQTDKRLGNIETDARETRKEIRTLFYFQIASFATLIGVMAKGFGWLK